MPTSWIQRLKQRLAGGAKLEVDAVKQALDDATEASTLADDDIEMLLQTFREQRDILHERIGTYPGNAVNAKDWLDGVGLGHLAVRFANLLEDAERTEAEFVARELAVNIGCIVEGHYHHVIGPRMVALIRCTDRLDKPEHVKALCDSVVKDFMWILEDNIDESGPLSAEDAISVWCLRFALEREASFVPAPTRQFTAAQADTVLERAPREDVQPDE